MRPAEGGVTSASTRRVFVERKMRARAQVVADVIGEHSVKPCRIHHDHVIRAFAPDRADDALHVGVLPRRRSAIRTA